jgi:nucleotide-binding universal stress UspA family protein
VIPIKKILVPIDFSDHSARALDHAIELAQRFEGSVHLLHSYPIHVGRIAPYGMVLPESFERECREAAEQHLAQWAERVAAQGVAVETSVTSTVASEAIVECAGEIEADLIVMGTRGLTGVAHVLLGSVAERTIRLAPCPVLTVKDATVE